MQLTEQSLGLLQIERVKAFGEPAVDRSEKIACLIPIALVARARGGRVRYCSDCVAKLSLRRPMNRDSVE